ncbi:MAG: YciI family protein [bacterium]
MPEPRVTVEDVLKASEGTLQKQMYVYFTTPTGGLGPVLENLKEHLAFQNDLERRGIMFGAGPHWTDDEKTWEGDGMVIVRAGSLAEAREIAESDPMHKSGARSFTARPWLMNEGTVTIKVTYSDGKREVL